MPIEINQLHIKVNVNGEDKQAQLPTSGNAQKEREGLIAACVEAVMEILERKEMR
jgi:hypothetical protein